MTHEEKINRMLEKGILTTQQADKLRSSIAAGSTVNTSCPTPEKKSYLIQLGLAVFVLTIIVIIYLVMQMQNVNEVSTVKDAMHDIGGSGMNRVILVISAFIFVLVVPIIIWVLTFNSLVSKEEKVIMSWAQVESNYQRRSDLIPTLVESVSRYMKHEKDTLSEVTEKRGQQFKQVQDNINDLIEDNNKSARVRQSFSGKPPTDQASLEKLNAIEDQIGQTMRKLIMVVESYPDLRSSEQFIALQAQLEGTENRINVARIRFNESVSGYNGAIRRFPGSLVAGVSGFKRKAYFESENGADKAKSLDFK